MGFLLQKAFRIAPDHNFKITILIWKHSSAGMSVRLTRERSWVRAPLFPSPRLGSENSGTKPFFIGFDGKSEEESVGSNEVHLNTCRGKGRQVGGGSVATVWKYWKRFTEWFSGLEWLELGIVPDGDSGYNG